MDAKPIFLHEHPQFKELLSIVAEKEGIHPVLVEKDYWIMHVLWGLQQQGYDFAMKGGTSLSKGYKIIDRFSEDIDILIEPPENCPFKVNSKSLKDNAVKSRKDFYDWLTDDIKIPGITKIARDHEFDDKNYYRGGGIRLSYETYTGTLEGVKDGILLEVGFSQVAPNEPITISSWTLDYAQGIEGISLLDNRAIDVKCYHPGYTLVEKIQTIIRNYRQEAADGRENKNFMRQYYDVYSLLKNPRILAFLSDPQYAAHKKEWIRGADAEIPVNEHPALLLANSQVREAFEKRYQSTSALYYRGQVPFAAVIATIHEHLPKM
jgi:hypothetical protein